MIIKPGSQSNRSVDNNWWTEYSLFKFLCKTYHFRPNCDMAATEANSLCGYFYDKELDALKQIKWKFPRSKKRLRGFLNPPNNKIGKFLLKAYEQYDKFGIQTMMIVPSNVEGTTSWWKAVEDPIDRGEKIFFKAIKGRPKFLLHGKRTFDDKGNELSSINAYKVVIFGRKKR